MPAEQPDRDLAEYLRVWPSGSESLSPVGVDSSEADGAADGPDVGADDASQPRAGRDADGLPDERGSGSAARAAVEQHDEAARRSVVPSTAGRSVWLAAVWTGAGAAVLCAVASIVAVAVCWLPASGASGNAGSAIRAGILTFLAALHAGITVDGVPTAFVPLGMTMIVGLIAWRAGCGLADAVDQLGEQRPARLLRIGAAQVAAFAVMSGVAAAFAALGTSAVSPAPAASGAAVLFVVTGGVAFVRWSPLADALRDRLPAEFVRVAARTARAALVGAFCYLGVAAAAIAGALIVHHDRVAALSAQVGGGWSGAPVLLLGILTAPNAVIAVAAYLAGPGFALGTGTHVSLFTTAHGVLPAFPLLGGVPTGPGAPWYALAVAAATPVLAGSCLAAVAMRAGTWPARLRDVGTAAVCAGLLGVALAWQGGGAIGSGRLNAVGASPWQFGLALCAELAVTATLALGIVALARVLHRWWTARRPRSDVDQEPGRLRTALRVVRTVVSEAAADKAVDAEHDEIADEPSPDKEITVKIPPNELAG